MGNHHVIQYNNKMLKDIKGFNLCAFLVGLEGWRRGLELTYYVDIHRNSNIHTQGKRLVGRNYSIANGEKIHYFNQSRGDMVDNETVKITNNKQKTKHYLEKAGISLLTGKEFEKEDSNEDIIKEAESIGYPVIIKPTNGSLSKGVILNIKNANELKDALVRVRNKMGYKRIILERYFTGDDIRLYVINEKVVAALRRLPAKVTGDGKHTIKELIEQKNESRKDNPYLAARPIKINRETRDVLKKYSYTVDTVLENGKTILVKNKSTMTQGVDLYDITYTVPSHVKQLAIDTLHALPNIVHGSIDMLFDGEKAYVLEVNASANISMHLFPTEGEPRNVPAHLIDFYFPETKDKSVQHTNMYFDYVNIIDMLQNNYTNSITINSLPDGEIHARRFIISGKVQKVGYRNWIRKKAIQRDIHGLARNLDDSTVEIVVASENPSNLERFKSLCKKGPKKAKVTSIKEYSWDEDLKSGFYVIKENKKKKKDNKKIKEMKHKLMQEMNELKKIYHRLEMENEKLKNHVIKQEKEIEKIKNSTSWKVTTPLRKISDLSKRR